MKKITTTLFFLVFSATCAVSCSKGDPVEQQLPKPSGKFVPKTELNSTAPGKFPESQPEKTPDEKKKEADESIADSFREHGRGSVLRHSDKLDKNEMTHGKYVINEPDYDMPPRPIEFKSLKKVYTYFRLREKLPQEVVEALNGSLVTMVGAVMPFEKIPEDGKFSTFWLSNPAIVMKDFNREAAA